MRILSVRTWVACRLGLGRSVASQPRLANPHRRRSLQARREQERPVPAGIENMRPLPGDKPMHPETVSAYEQAFEKPPASLGGRSLRRTCERLASGSYSLHWMDTDGGRWGKRAKPSVPGPHDDGHQQVQIDRRAADDGDLEEFRAARIDSRALRRQDADCRRLRRHGPARRLGRQRQIRSSKRPRPANGTRPATFPGTSSRHCPKISRKRPVSSRPSSPRSSSSPATFRPSGSIGSLRSFSR